MVPAQFRQILRPLLEEVASKFQQLEAARSHLSKWEAFQAAGTFPPWCSAQAPAVQFTKGFEESEQGRTFRSTLASGHSAYQKQLLASYIGCKRQEIAQIEAATTPDQLLALAQPVVQERYKSLKRRRPYSRNGG
jgi:glutathione S-transferase